MSVDTFECHLHTLYSKESSPSRLPSPVGTLSIYLRDISSDRSPRRSAVVMLSQDAILAGAHQSRSLTAIAQANKALQDAFAKPAN